MGLAIFMFHAPTFHCLPTSVGEVYVVKIVYKIMLCLCPENMNTF